MGLATKGSADSINLFFSERTRLRSTLKWRKCSVLVLFKMSLAVLFFWLPLLNFTLVYSSYPVTFVDTNSCKEFEYYDISRLRCLPCSAEEGTQRSTSDGLSCECMPNHRITLFRNGKFSCEPCPENQVTSLDGWHCIRCSSNQPFQNGSQSCVPCTDGVEVEMSSLEKQCLPCADFTRPDLTGERCVHCPEDLILASNGSCDCPKEKFFLSGGVCIPNSDSLPVDGKWATLTLQSGLEVKSALFQEHLQAVIYQCKALSNVTACHMLANLCVLTLYNSASNKGSSVACDQFLKIANHDVPTSLHRSEIVPKLFYSEGDAHLELSKTNVPNKFSLNSQSSFSRLNLVAATYSLQGTFLGFRNVTPATFVLCPGVRDDLGDGFVFGAKFQRTCKLRVHNLWSDSTLVFFELYLLHFRDGKMEMYPVPVLIKNLQKNDELINKGKKQSKWQLTRRFFLTDTISGIMSDDTSRTPTAKYLRYVDNIYLKIRVRDDEDGEAGSIFPPLLVVRYSEVTKEELFYISKVSVSFSVNYEMTQSKTFYSIIVALSVLSSIAVIWSLFQTWSWARRAGKRNTDIQTLGKFLIFGSGNLANVFFMVVLCASVNWLVIFKRQDVVHLLLPTPEQEDSTLVYVSAAFALKCLQIVHMLVVQCTIHIFFIDWERPRSGQKGLATRRTSVRVVDETSIQGSESGNLSGIGSVKQGSSEKAFEGSGVSIWRTYFVASTWADLQTMRRVKPSLQLFLMLCCLQVMGFENLSLSDPYGLFERAENQQYTPYSATCRFAIGASLYLTIAFIQYMTHRVIYERFFEDKLQQFIDLCSVSNISVFIMSLPRFGYYIHGRSAHGRADVNMKEMHEHLRREEEDLCGHRGLLPNTEQQTFSLLLPEGVGDQYRRLLLPLTSYSQTADRMQGVGGRLARVDIERVVNTYHMVNKFLSGYIEHAFKDLDYAVKDRLLMENILDAEFSEIEDRGFFYNDNSHSFDSLLFCGQECSLVVFESLLFCLVDLAAQNFALAAIFTYLFYKVIEAIRKSAGRRNLVRKALVDERFLNT